MEIYRLAPSEILKTFRPFFRIVGEAAEAGMAFGTEAAKFQKETGIAGQKGAYGGGPFTPEGIRQEQQMFTFTPSTRQF
jgi:hypothetical protein